MSSEWKSAVSFITSSPYWAFAPLALILVATLILVGKEFGWLGPLKTTERATNFRDDYPMKQIWNATYDNQTVYLDGYEYIECTFGNVLLRFDGNAPFRLTNVHFTPNATIQLGSINPAVKQTTMLLSILAQQGKFIGTKMIPADKVSKPP
jgi:hypothetical protein